MKKSREKDLIKEVGKLSIKIKKNMEKLADESLEIYNQLNLAYKDSGNRYIERMINNFIKWVNDPVDSGTVSPYTQIQVSLSNVLEDIKNIKQNK